MHKYQGLLIRRGTPLTGSRTRVRSLWLFSIWPPMIPRLKGIASTIPAKSAGGRSKGKILRPRRQIGKRVRAPLYKRMRPASEWVGKHVEVYGFTNCRG